MTTKRNTPPLHWLKAFEVSARTLNFTHAAEELLITQSAISKQIKNLEHYLGHELFRRERGGMRLTEAGMNYLPTIIRGFNALEQGTHNFLNYSGNVDLIIKSNYAFATLWLSQNIGEFMDLHPMIRCTISPALWEQDFSTSNADIEIHYGREDWLAGNAIQLTNEKLVPVCAPQTYARITRVEDFEHERILDLTGIGDTWDYWMAQRDLKGLELLNRHYFGTFVLSLAVAAEGSGIALAHGSLASKLVEKGELIPIWDLSVPSRDNYFAVKKKERSEGAELFLSWLKSRLAQTPRSDT